MIFKDASVTGDGVFQSSQEQVLDRTGEGKAAGMNQDEGRDIHEIHTHF